MLDLTFRRAVVGALACLLLLSTATSVPAAPEGRDPDVVAHLRTAETAKSAGDVDGAESAYLRALALEPAATDVLGALIALRKDRDRRALWVYHAALAGCDDRGVFKLPREWTGVDKDDAAVVSDLVKARAKAARSAASATQRLRGAVQAPGLWYLNGLARLLAQGSPALEALQRDAAAKVSDKLTADPDKVIKALRAILATPGDDAVVLEAARILRGLHQQKGQKDAKSSGVGDSAETVKIQQVIDRIRAGQKASDAKVWTVEELAAIPEAERPQWSAEHATWANPGVAVSTTGKYRLETVCGLETLLIAADEVEVHHRRLAGWFGVDPFDGRQGTIRLCDSYADMESEGEPFWWAGGWQSGDRTTVLVNFTDNIRLGALLTHELTHRFDGLVHANLPAWLVEGRAVYTESCSPNPGSLALDERVYLSGRLWDAHSAGYGRPDMLERLLKGDIDDYRHNYDAGYALWLFLTRFRGFDGDQQGPAHYAPRVKDYLASFRKQMQLDPVARFTSYFCDGQDGRAKSLPELCRNLYRFWVEASQGGAEPEWRKRWNEEHNAALGSVPPSARRTIFDRGASPRTRLRHDPPDYGQYHAYRAGRLFQQLGRRTDAFEAYAWALAVDELDAAQLAVITAFLEEEGSGFVPWVIQHRLQRARPFDVTAPAGPAPGALGAAWKAADDVCAALASAEAAQRKAERTVLADALRAEHDLLAAWIGRAQLGPLGDVATPTATIRTDRAPHCPPFTGALLAGVIAERWAPLDTKDDVAWNRPVPSSVELGREAGDAATTGTLRDARERKVFVRTLGAFAGTYTLRTRVRFLSAYADARLVIGQTHRDRGVEVRVSGGDWNYAVGDSNETYPLTHVSVGIGDLRPIDWEQSPLFDGVGFDSPKDTFDLTVHVAGPYVRVVVNEREVVTHRVSDGQPVEGHVGFGLSRGIVRFEEPEVRVHRAHGPHRSCACGTFDEPFDPSRGAVFPWNTAIGRRVVGLPKHPGGTMLALYTDRTPPSARIQVIVKSELDALRQPFAKDGLDVALHLLVPQPADGEVESAALRFPPAAELDLPEARFHRYAPHQGLTDLLDAEARQWAASEVGRNADLDIVEAVKRAREVIFGSPTWVMLDDENVIRSCFPDASRVYAWSLAHRLAGW